MRARATARWVAVLALPLCSTLGCGGRTDIDDQGSSAPDATVTSGPFECEAEGIRFCGEHDLCPPFGFPECTGVGCTPAGDRSNQESLEIGVCWPDIPSWVNSPCIACDDGEVCVHDDASGLFCVPFGVCAKLWELGATTACRYADKSAFTNAPLAVSLSCPEPDNAFCGGACEPCPLEFPCVGRSATKPLGICVEAFGGIYQCSASDPSPCSTTGDICALFRVDPADQPFADRFGVCVQSDVCAAASAAGLVDCL